MNDIPETDEIRTGKILYYNPNRLFGVVRDDLTRKKLFMHKRVVKFPEDQLHAGTHVLFQIVDRYDNTKHRMRAAACPVWLAEDLPEQDPDDGHTNYFEEAEKVERAERGRKGKW